jgi:hypothetical protein
MGDTSWAINRFFGEESPLITVLKEVVALLRVIVAQQAALVSKK